MEPPHIILECISGAHVASTPQVLTSTILLVMTTVSTK